MDTNHIKSAPSMLGKGNPGSKLKGGNSMSSSPGNTNFNNCSKSPHSGINNGRRSVSPFLTADIKTDELISKKGIHSSGFPDLSSSPPISLSTCISNIGSSKREGCKLPVSGNPTNETRSASSPYMCLPSPNEMKGNTISSRKETMANRPEKALPINHILSGDRSQGLRNRNNYAKRNNSIDCPSVKDSYNQKDHSFSPTRAYGIKGSDKANQRQSPRGELVNETGGRTPVGYNSPSLSYPSPSSSSEHALTPVTNTNRSKLKTTHEIGSGTPASSIANTHMTNHLSRTSSSNSISDMSRCSEVTDDVGHADGSIATSSESSLTRNSTSPGRSVPPLNMDTTLQQFSSYDEDRAIVDALGTLTGVTESNTNDNKVENLPGDQPPGKVDLNLDGNFQFPDDDTGPADIGQKALNLSAEDVRQTLNSVSADSDLPDLGSDANVFDDNPSMIINNGVDFNITPTSHSFNAGDAGAVLPTSVAAVSVAVSTSSTTSVVTSSVSSVPTTLPSTSSTLTPTGTGTFSNDVFPPAGAQPFSSQTSSATSSTSSPFTGTSATEPGRSHLQDILGVTDTDRLKKMGQPVDSTQYHSATTSTSFSSNNPPPGQLMPNSSTGPIQNLPSTTFNRHPSPNGGNNNIYHRNPNFYPRNAYGGPQHPMMYDHAGMHHGGYVEHGLPRASMPYEPGMSPHHHPAHGNVPFNQGPQWQGPPVGNMMPPPGPDGNKSPRGQMGPGFPHRPINPMSGLESTVNSIPQTFPPGPGIGSMTRNNNNNMGPPSSYQGTPGGNGAFPLSPMTPRPMLPPQSPSIQQEKHRSTSADSSVTNTSLSKKSNKRERGQSVDSKDSESKSGPKSKRKKRSSKDDSKKTASDAKASSRSNSVSEHQGNSPCMYVFNSEVANAAAKLVCQGKVPTMVSYHQSTIRNCRLFPSNNSSVVPSGMANKMPDPAGPLPRSGGGTARGVFPNNPGPPTSQQNHNVKTEANLTSPRQNARETSKTKDSGPVKSEFDTSNPDPAISKTSPPTSKPITFPTSAEENLSAEQIRHREHSLKRIQSIGNILLQEPHSNPGPMPPSSNGRMPPRGPGSDYAMSKYLIEVQKNNPAYNDGRKRMKQEGMDMASPPPYHPGGPRWVGPGPGMRDLAVPMPPGPEMMNPRYPHNIPMRGNPVRMPYDGPHMHRDNVPRGYMGPGGPGLRMPMYPGGGMPPTGVVVGPKGQRPPGARMSQPLNHSNEIYPFSEKLKEQASIYRTDGMHLGQGGNMPYDINNPEMGPDWQPYGNPGSMPPGGRLSHMPETVSPSHMNMNPGMMMSSSGPMPATPMDPVQESRLTPNVDPVAMRMNNPICGPNFPFHGKGPSSLPNYTESPMPGMAPHSMGSTFSSHDLRPSNNQLGSMNLPQDRPSGSMVDTMERRGEPRPPDLKLNTSVPRSPMSYPNRHPMTSPSMANTPMVAPGQSQFMHNEFGPSNMPQVSPHPGGVPRSPMNSSPGGAMNNPSQFMGVGGPGGSMPNPMSVEHPSMMQSGAGPLSGDRGPGSEWAPPSSMAPRRVPSGMMSSQGPRSQSAITEMIHKIKDTSSPPPLSHMNGNNMLAHEPPPLTHNPNSDPGAMLPNNMAPMIRTPNGQVVPHQLPPGGAPPGYDPGMSGPRSVGPRPMGPHSGEGYMGDYQRPPSHSSMCMSPSMQGGQPNMMNPEMEMRGYMPSQNSVMGGGGGPPPPGNMPNQGGASQEIPAFDLTHIIPRDKPSETLSYFPPTDRGPTQEAGQAESSANNQQPGRSPTAAMQPPSMTRFQGPGMSQRPVTPGSNPYPGNPSMRPIGLPGNYRPSNPPNYQPDSYMYHMPGRPPMMNSGPGPGMHSGYPGGRAMM